MALVATYTHENCEGIPKGATVRIYDDHLAPDQKAAWAKAREINERIYWQIQRQKLAERMKNNHC